MARLISIVFFFVILSVNSLAQQPANTGYPKTTGYISAVNPILSLDKSGVTYNFTDYYTIGFPCGVNILKSDKFGYSFEVAPFVKFTGSSSKTSNILIHPGVIFRYPHGFNLVTRLAFETAGRYGATVILNKVFYKTPSNSYWFSVPFPMRFGNDNPTSIGIAVQFGVTF